MKKNKSFPFWILKIIVFSSSCRLVFQNSHVISKGTMSVNPLTLWPSSNSHLLWQPSYDASFWHIRQLASQMLFNLGFLPTLIFFSYHWSLILILCNCPILKSKFPESHSSAPTASCIHSLFLVLIHLELLYLPIFCSDLVNCRLCQSWHEHLSNENLKFYRSQTKSDFTDSKLPPSKRPAQSSHRPSPLAVLGLGDGAIPR